MEREQRFSSGAKHEFRSSHPHSCHAPITVRCALILPGLGAWYDGVARQHVSGHDLAAEAALVVQGASERHRGQPGHAAAVQPCTSQQPPLALKRWPMSQSICWVQWRFVRNAWVLDFRGQGISALMCIDERALSSTCFQPIGHMAMHACRLVSRGSHMCALIWHSNVCATRFW